MMSHDDGCEFESGNDDLVEDWMLVFSRSFPHHHHPRHEDLERNEGVLGDSPWAESILYFVSNPDP
jgi:hypothetical protein